MIDLQKITVPKVVRWLVRHAMHVAFVGMLVYFAITTSDARFGFPGRIMSPENLLNILNQNFAYLVLGVGMTLVVVTGGIDLSVGSVAALCGVVATTVMMRWMIPGGHSVGLGMFVGIVLALAAGAGVGLVNGVMITRFRVPPFIATLAWFLIARGLAFKLCGARPVGNLPASFTWLGQGQVGPTLFHTVDGRAQQLWFPVLVAFLLAGAAHLLLQRTVFGRHVVSVGGNEEAARLSGIRVARKKVAVYVVSGLLAAVCGILLAARLQAGDPKVGSQPPLELGAITAVVLGGAALTGGKGSIGGTVFGALFMGVLDNGLALNGLQYFDQLVVKGAVLLAAVLFDQLKDRV